MDGLGQMLAATLSADHFVRSRAEDQLRAFQQQQFGPFLLALSRFVATEGNDDNHSRQLAAILIKNALTPKQSSSSHLEAEWQTLSEEQKTQLLENLVQGLTAPTPVAFNAARCIVLVVQLAVNTTPQAAQPPPVVGGVMALALQRATGGQVEEQKEPWFRLLDVACEELPPEILAPYIAPMLDATAANCNPDKPVALRRTATLALASLLGCGTLSPAQAQLAVESACNAAINLPEGDDFRAMELRAVGLTCLTRFAGSQYDNLQPFMPTLTNFVVEAIGHANDEVARAAMEFFCTLCDEESDRIKANQTNRASTGAPRCFEFCRRAVPTVVPALLALFPYPRAEEEQEEVDDEDERVLQEQAVTCLGLLSVVAEAEVTPFVLATFQQHVESEDWKNVTMALHALGCLVCKQSPERAGIVSQALPVVVRKCAHDHAEARRCAVWALSRVCEFQVDVVVPQFPAVCNALVATLHDRSRVAEQGLCCIRVFVSACSSPPASQLLEMQAPRLLQELWALSERNEDDLAPALLYEPINSLLEALPELEVAQQLVQPLLERFRLALGLSTDAAGWVWRGHIPQLCSLCGALFTCLGDRLRAQAPEFVHMLCLALEGNDRDAPEDALLGIAHAITAVEQDAVAFVPRLRPLLVGFMRGSDQVATVATGVVGDLARLGGNNEVITNAVLACAQEALDVARSNGGPVNHAFLSLFGDVALSAGDAFAPLLPSAVEVCERAFGEAMNNEEAEDRTCLLESVFDAYTGMVHGIDPGLVSRFRPTLLRAVERIAANPHVVDESVVRASVMLLADLYMTEPAFVRAFVQEHNQVSGLVRMAMDGGVLNEDDLPAVEGLVQP